MPTIASLPERKQKYVRARAKGLSRTKAALSAGYAHATAVAANTRIETPDVRAVFQKLVQDALPPKALLDTLKAGLEATDTRLASFEGQFTDERKVPDYGERRAYLELAAEYGGYVAKDQQPAGSLHVIAMVTRQSPQVQSSSVQGSRSGQPTIDVESVKPAS